MAEGGSPAAAVGRDGLVRVEAPPAARHVEVAVDAAGVAGSRTWTYLVPDSLADVAAGEAVLVEWGRRRAVGIVLGDAPAPDGVTARPLGARVRADGPLLPPLALSLAREIAAHYLAPPALAIRAMLPPGLLEKLELVATPLDPPAPTPAPGFEPSKPGPDPATADLLLAIARGPRAVRDLPAPDGRASLLRRLRALEGDGRVHLEWTLTAAGAGPRHERIARLTDAGREVAGGSRAPDGRSVGPRPRALLLELAGLAPDDPGAGTPGSSGASPASSRRSARCRGPTERPSGARDPPATSRPASVRRAMRSWRGPAPAAVSVHSRWTLPSPSSARSRRRRAARPSGAGRSLSLIHISEPT